MSIHRHGSCGALFDFSYNASSGKYLPKTCPKCAKDVRPPQRLIDTGACLLHICLNFLCLFIFLSIVRPLVTAHTARSHLGAKKTVEDIATKLTIVAAKSGIRTGAAYIPYAGQVVSVVGEAAVDEAVKQNK